jgi:hypothetical protein
MGCTPADVDLNVAADYPAQQSHSLVEGANACLIFRIDRGCGQKHANAARTFALLPAPSKRHRRRAHNSRNELPPLHSITSSASASSFAGISRLVALAVARFMTNRKRVGCSNGRSAGFAPLKMRSTMAAAR